jgi:hypothetical protein
MAYRPKDMWTDTAVASFRNSSGGPIMDGSVSGRDRNLVKTPTLQVSGLLLLRHSGIPLSCVVNSLDSPSVKMPDE